MVLALGLTWHQPWRPGVVVGHSMAPALADLQPYLFDLHYYARHRPQRGDVVVFDHAGETLIKRVVAVGGERVTLVEYAAGGPPLLVEGWDVVRLRRLVRNPVFKQSVRLREAPVPPGYCFLAGDNRSSSYDSCDFGPVAESAIRGKVLGVPPLCDGLRFAASPADTSRL